jgi:drug/metabolite transporter (DMT)-like permease
MKPSTAIKAFLAILFWGASFVATKIALREISPLTIITLRFAMGVSMLMLVVTARREFTLPRRGDLVWLALLGLNGITIHQLLQANGLVTTSATNSGWIVALTPIFSALLAWLMLHEAFGLVKVLGLVVASVGALLVISRGQLSGGLLNLPTTPGDFLILLSSPNWALFTVLSKRMMRKFSPALMMTFVMLFGWLAILPLFAGARSWLELSRLTAVGWGGVLFLGLLCSGAAYVFWYDALQVAGASQVAAFLYIEPIVTVIVAATLIGEVVRWTTLLGGAIILAGVWLVNQTQTSS